MGEIRHWNFYVYVLQIVVCPFVLFSFGHCCLSFFDLRILITSLVSSNCFLCTIYISKIVQYIFLWKNQNVIYYLRIETSKLQAFDALCETYHLWMD
jgi:hypothetical protein